MIMSKILSFLLLWLVIIPLAHGQQRVLKGSLVDLATNAPLGGATVPLNRPTSELQLTIKGNLR